MNNLFYIERTKVLLFNFFQLNERKTEGEVNREGSLEECCTKPEKIGNCESRKQERVTILVREKIMGTMH